MKEIMAIVRHEQDERDQGRPDQGRRERLLRARGLGTRQGPGQSGPARRRQERLRGGLRGPGATRTGSFPSAASTWWSTTTWSRTWSRPSSTPTAPASPATARSSSCRYRNPSACARARSAKRPSTRTLTHQLVNKKDENMARKKTTFAATDLAEFKEEVLKKYPPKVARKRKKQIQVNEVKDDKAPEIQANVRTIPGIITMRGCTYAGCKGVILGPTRDILNITHGPIGCGFYSWLTRRNQTQPGPDGDNYMPYAFSTDMQDEDIIFGGEKKLKQAIQEAYDTFKPQGHRGLRHLPRGAHRRRYPRRDQGDEGEAGHQLLRLLLRGLQGRVPVRRPPHRQQPDIQARGGHPGEGAGQHVQHQPAGRVQYRRRRLRHRGPAGALRHLPGVHLLGQLLLRASSPRPTPPT